MRITSNQINRELGHPIQIAKMLDTYEWKYYCTLSTRYSLSMKKARALMEQMNERLREVYPQLNIAWAAEPFDTKEGNHLHVLISLTIDGFVDFEHGKSMIINAWLDLTSNKSAKANSYAYIVEYKKGLGGSYYLAKYINRPNSDYDFFF